MNLNIKTLNSFEKDVKRLFKKYKLLPSDLKILKVELLQNPKSGIELGNGCYKIRLANSFRVIYYYIDTNNNLHLISIYSKNELENIDDKIIIQILKENSLL